MSGATVTPSGVREGDPTALAALCAARGPSVLAYCRQVAGEADAGAAAADAFARFRVAVVAAGDTSTLDPEALLIGVTRTSAATRAGTSGGEGVCAEVPGLLAARAEKTIAAAELERLESHLEQCWGCRAPVARFKAAERAYRDPPEKTIEPTISALIVGALIAAVPSAPPPGAVAGAANGGDPQPAIADPGATQSFAIDQATEHFAAAGMVEPDLADIAADAEAQAEAKRSAGKERRSRRSGRPAVIAALLPRMRRASGPRQQPGGTALSEMGEPATPREPARPREPAGPRAPRERSRSALRIAIVLPVVLVLLALLAALFVSGVFGSDDPASSPSVSAPAAESDAAAKPELVVVPGSEDASARAVEDAKARARGESGSARKDAGKPDRATKTSAPAASASPPAAAPPATPAVSANNAVNPPPARPPAPAPERDAGSASDPPKQIDAGSGATGAEQIPPAQDTSNVPDLAPPP